VSSRSGGTRQACPVFNTYIHTYIHTYIQNDSIHNFLALFTLSGPRGHSCALVGSSCVPNFSSHCEARSPSRMRCLSTIAKLHAPQALLGARARRALLSSAGRSKRASPRPRTSHRCHRTCRGIHTHTHAHTHTGSRARAYLSGSPESAEERRRTTP